METQDIFKNFLLDIQKVVSPSTYSVWFNDLELINMNDKEVQIKVPLQLHKQILKQTYIDLFEEL